MHYYFIQTVPIFSDSVVYQYRYHIPGYSYICTCTCMQLGRTCRWDSGTSDLLPTSSIAAPAFLFAASFSRWAGSLKYRRSSCQGPQTKRTRWGRVRHTYTKPSSTRDRSTYIRVSHSTACKDLFLDEILDRIAAKLLFFSFCKYVRIMYACVRWE